MTRADELRNPIAVDVMVMKTTAGADFFVRIQCGGRSVTPYMFKERFKAEYSADHFAWLFGLRSDEPDLMAYGPESHPNAALITREGSHEG